MNTFDEALKFTLGREGGYSDHPADRGGKTLWGVTQHTYDAYRARMHKQLQSVKLMTKEEMESIYQRDYWIAAGCQNMPRKLAICHFDAAVNHGPKRANKILQQVLGVKQDGIIGSKTMAAISGHDEDELVKEYLEVRHDFFCDICEADPGQSVFLAGWLNRIEHVRDYLT